MGVLDPQRDRAELQRMIGYEAEALVHKFCVIDRDDFVSVACFDCSVLPIPLAVGTQCGVYAQFQRVGRFTAWWAVL